MGTDITLQYYKKYASQFVKSTLDVDFSETQEKFLGYLKKGAYILDFGCGSGRDAKYFLSKGYQVEAIDGCKKLCKMASEYTGLSVDCIDFMELSSQERYEGIWACSSILHLSYKDLICVFYKIAKALKPNGIVYSSFKYGEKEEIRNGRFFINMTEEKMNALFEEMGVFLIQEMWITSDIRPGRSDEKWFNIIGKKK